MIRTGLSLVAGDATRLIILAVVVASATVFMGFGAPACGVALLVEVVWAVFFVLSYLLLRTVADLAGVFHVEEVARERD